MQQGSHVEVLPPSGKHVWMILCIVQNRPASLEMIDAGRLRPLERSIAGKVNGHVVMILLIKIVKTIK